MKWVIKYVHLRHKILKFVFYAGLLIKIVVLAVTLDPHLADAASPPWTITTEYAEIDSVHTKPHKGIDFALPEGTPIKSVTEGTVISTRDYGNVNLGKSVMIQSGDKVVMYGHLADQLVEVGDKIDFGETIGISGNTGRSTGPHLHFQVTINGKPIDPRPTIWQGMMKKALVGGE
jgi:murein DD-endopeptidase MepM/ murein hydrolase activator NlpD